ncbi:MAG: pyruvate, water dikinase regulatory protein [Pseudomonadota bacterium]
MSSRRPHNYFHLHMISDATGETLLAVARAATARYASVRAIEHTYPLVRSKEQLDSILLRLDKEPGIVMYTLVDPTLSAYLEERCAALACPAASILEPALNVLRNYLGAEEAPRVGAQHVLDGQYFRRIDALNFTLAHDDGQLSDEWANADILLLGISRTSKTPTSIYLANRGFRTANLPLVPSVPLPDALFRLNGPLIVGLVASAERIRQVRENRLSQLAPGESTSYTDRVAVTEEVAWSKKLLQRHGWPMIDVTRRSIEETAAAVISIHNNRQSAVNAEASPS